MSYTGITVSIPLGLEGLTGNTNVADIRPTQLIEAKNITFTDNSISKERGAALLAQVPGNALALAGYDWWTPTQQRMVVYTADGRLLKDTGSGTFPVTLASGLQPEVLPVFVEGGAESIGRSRKLVCFAAGQPPRVLAADGATMTVLATPPADWIGTNQPTVGVLHANRLWGAGNVNDPHRLYHSQVTDHENFTGAGSGTLSVSPGEGEHIAGLVSYKGLLVVFKFPRGIYLVDTRDVALTNWSIVRLSGVFGLPGPLAVTLIDNDILFLTPSGQICLLSSVQEFGNLGGLTLSQAAMIDTFLEPLITYSRFPAARMLYYPRRREMILALTALASARNDRRVTIDFKLDVPRFRWGDRDQNEALWLRRDTTGQSAVVVSDHTGGVWSLDQEGYTKGGTGYTGSFQTPHLDGSHADPALASRRKNGGFLTLGMTVQSENTPVLVDVFWDGNFSETLTFYAGIAGPIFDDIFLDTTVLGAGYTGGQATRRVKGSGIRVSFRVYNGTNNESFTIWQMLFLFAIGGNRASRDTFS
jgi:hypothetical protein